MSRAATSCKDRRVWTKRQHEHASRLQNVTPFDQVLYLYFGCVSSDLVNLTVLSKSDFG